MADTWRPNYRIGPVLFNQPLGDDVQVLDRDSGGRFAVRPRGGGPVVRGILFDDPNTGRTGARAIWTRSKEIVPGRAGRCPLAHRQAPAPGPLDREAPRALRLAQLVPAAQDRTGPVSTQLFFRRATGRIFEIALNEITEIGCPRA